MLCLLLNTLQVMVGWSLGILWSTVCHHYPYVADKSAPDRTSTGDVQPGRETPLPQMRAKPPPPLGGWFLTVGANVLPAYYIHPPEHLYSCSFAAKV